MQSLKSKIIIGLIKKRHLLKFKLKPEVIDESFDVKRFRDNLDNMSNKLNKEYKDIIIKNIKIKDMNAEWIIPEGAPDEKVIMYIHGGGFISGSCLTHRIHAVKFARACGVKILLFDYRLAPEHPFPIPLDDCIIAYKYLLHKGYNNHNIIIMGESSGGTLTLSSIVALRDKGVELPKAVVSISPVTDLTCTAESFSLNAKKDIAPLGSWTTWTRYYISNNDPHNKWLSPLMSDLSHLPPLMIQLGTCEIHLDDAKNFAYKAKDSGVDVTLRIWDGMIHAFPLLAPLFPEANNAIKEISNFIRNHLKIQ